jgi:hypothetical protein
MREAAWTEACRHSPGWFVAAPRSVTLLLRDDEVNRPAAANATAQPTEMAENDRLRAAGFFLRIGQDRQAHPVKFTAKQRALGVVCC